MDFQGPEEVVRNMRTYRATLVGMHDRFLAKLCDMYMADHTDLCREIEKAVDNGASPVGLMLMIVGLGTVSLEINRDMTEKLEKAIRDMNEGEEWKNGNDSV